MLGWMVGRRWSTGWRLMGRWMIVLFLVILANSSIIVGRLTVIYEKTDNSEVSA
jgi:hypothetical protein